MKTIKIALCLFLFSQKTTAQCWHQVWADEFETATLDLTKWEPQVGGGGWGNNELQFYTARPENIEISGGSLKIIARAESYSGSDYTSARLRTKNLADFTYGKFEAEIKLPAGQGLWPAYWMLPTESYYGTWPAGGEIDFMEYLGQNTNIAYQTIHCGMPLTSSSSTYVLPSGSFSGSFHIFSAEWAPNIIRFYVDGTLVATKTPADIPPPATWRFDRIFHQILNLAVGGNWPGPPSGSTQFPATMEVKYARIFQKNEHLAIIGLDHVEPGATGISYKLPAVGGSYIWSVPSGATIASGQGTNQITVNFGATGGNISCALNNACGTATRVLPVLVTPNLIKNPGFEQDLLNWSTSACCGAAADFAVSTTNNPPGGLRSICADVQSLGPDSWNVQFTQPVPTVMSGLNYTLQFQAKCDAVHPVAAALWRPSGTVMYHDFPSIGTSWAQYSYSFTPVFSMPAGAMQLNFDLGAETGEYCFDQILLAKTSTLPLELVDFQAVAQPGGNLLRWASASESGLERYEIERGIDGSFFEKMGELPALNIAAGYSFLDEKPTVATTVFYRLKIVEKAGAIGFSKIISIQKGGKPTDVQVFPNPSRDVFFVEISPKKGDSEARLDVFDSMGRQLETHFFAEKMTLDGADWPVGSYFLKIWMDDGTHEIRVVKRP